MAGKKCKNQKQRLELVQDFGLYNGTRKVFTSHPQSVFAVGQDFVVTGRHLDKTFILYDLHALSRKVSVLYHKAGPSADSVEHRYCCPHLRPRQTRVHRRYGWHSGSVGIR